MTTLHPSKWCTSKILVSPITTTDHRVAGVSAAQRYNMTVKHVSANDQVMSAVGERED